MSIVADQPVQRLSVQDPAGAAFDESSPSSQELVRRVREGGDDAAARLLIERLYPLVLKLVRTHRPRRTAEEDLAQTIFARIFHRLEQYSGAVPLEHWISRIAINICLDQIESERVRPELRHADLSEAQAAVVELAASCETEVPDNQATAAREVVHALLDQLKPKERLIITLFHLEERSVNEISALTGWSRPLVKVRAFRARRKLRALYEKLHPDLKLDRL